MNGNAKNQPPNPQDCKPTLRPAAVYELTELVRDALKTTHVNAQQTCLTCMHFKEHAGEFCARWAGRPPARVIAYGCFEYWQDDEIPY